MPYFKLNEVAQRLNANESWLKNRINVDRRSAMPRLQFHHYVGTSPVWTLEAFESLRDAIADELEDRRHYRGRGRPRKGWEPKRRPIGVIGRRALPAGENPRAKA